VIEARDLTFGYRRDHPVVAGWSACVAAGETVAVVGPSGCGKSTLLYVLGTLVRPWAGSLMIGGRSVDRLGDAARSDIRAGLIGFVFQDALLDQRRSVLDNIVEGAVYRGTPRRAALARAMQLLAQLDVDVEPNRRATDLSGGQAQRVGLCRALLNEPAVILADEPTGNLDAANARAVEDVLFAQARAGAALVIVTHDEALAGRCDRVSPL
jgi:ABC-type lipoprotein export system ATPase subunit